MTTSKKRFLSYLIPLGIGLTFDGLLINEKYKQIAEFGHCDGEFDYYITQSFLWGVGGTILAFITDPFKKPTEEEIKEERRVKVKRKKEIEEKLSEIREKLYEIDLRKQKLELEREKKTFNEIIIDN